MYQIKVEEENQKITKIRPEDKSKEELVTIVYDLEYCITNLEEQNSSLKNETSILEEQVSIFKEKNEENEKKVKEEYAARNQELLLEKGAMMERDKANAEIVEKEKRKRKEFQKKYEELLEKFQNQKVIDVPEASQMPRERKGKTTVVSIAELAQVTEQFINDGPEAAMMSAEWIFSKSNEFDVVSRLHYLVNNVFRRTGESRDSILKVASLLSNLIQSKEIPTWNRVVEIIISSIDTNKRREMVWKEFEKLRTEGLKADGSNYEMYVLTWNKAKMYWESFTKDQRFRELLKGLDHATTIEVLRNKHGLSQQQFEESDEKLWFTWIKDAIRTISAALEIRQNSKTTTTIQIPIQAQHLQLQKQIQTQIQKITHTEQIQPQQIIIRGTTPITNATSATKSTIEEQTVQKEATISCNNLTIGGQAPKLLAIRIKIADKWYPAIVDTGCTHSLIHPRWVNNFMKRIGCHKKITTPFASEPHISNSLVNVKFNLETDVRASTSLNMYVAPIPYSIILGLDFMSGVDILTLDNSRWLLKYYNGQNKSLKIHIPVYYYPVNKSTKLRTIKVRAGSYLDFKLNPHQIIHMTKIDLDESIILTTAPTSTSTSITSTPTTSTSTSITSTPTTSTSTSITSTPTTTTSTSTSTTTPTSNTTIPITTSSTPPNATTSTNNSPNIMDEDQRAITEAQKILNQFKDIFVEQIPIFEPPKRPGFDMEVKVTAGSLPIKRSYNKMSQEESNKIENEVAKLLQAGVIEESTSSYSAPVFIATRKGKERVVFDYRGVNKQTEEFAYPMPNGEEILKATKNCKYFSVVDAKSGFHLLQLKEEHRSFTAFTFKGKLYQFRRAPFGMKNSPAYFNKWIQSIMDEFQEFARAYVDDIIIFSKTLEDHVGHLRKVLVKLRNEKVYLNGGKVELFKDNVKFFGHMVSKDGFKPVLDKVEAIINLPEPTTITELRSFLGSCNYLRRFIPNYAELTCRLATLTGTKTTRITITDEMREDIQKLKESITSAPVLAKPDYNRSFDVYIDASNIGTGCVIMQDDGNGNIRPILYDSCRFNKYQKNYSTTDREFLALINVLERHGYMLKDKRFRLFTDHLNLTYYEELKEPTKRIIRYLDKASEFKFDIIHVKGEDNHIADMLSRDGTFDSTWEPEFVENIKKSYSKIESKDAEWFELFKARQDVVNVDDLWYLIDAHTGSKRLLVMDKDIIRLILEEAHNTIYSGHSSKNKMVNKLRSNYFFPKFIQTVARFADACMECQKNRIIRAKNGLLNPLPIPSRPWNDISMDFLCLPKSNSGKDNAMVVVCRLSKMCKIIPCTKELKADEAARLFWDNIVCNFGLPATIISDRDKLFTSDLWNSLMELAGVKLKMTAPGRPQADGQTERMNRNIINLLSKMTTDRLDWDIEIKSIEFAINNTVNSSTGQTPFSILFGFEPRTPINVNTDYNLPYIEAAEYYRQAARDNMVDAQITMATQYNKDRDDFKFEVGDLVLVKREKLNIVMLNDKDQSKVLPNYCGPFKITQKKGNLNYSIRIQNHKGGNRVVHVSDMKPFIEDDRKFFKRNDSNYKPLEEEIEKIVDKQNRAIGRGHRIEYRVRFKGKTEDHDLWLPLYALEGASKFIKNFEESNKVLTSN
ncbi:hypothetical protein ACTA71_006234 [Dictyostelium dimigraforme]